MITRELKKAVPTSFLPPVKQTATTFGPLGKFSSHTVLSKQSFDSPSFITAISFSSDNDDELCSFLAQ